MSEILKPLIESLFRTGALLVFAVTVFSLSLLTEASAKTVLCTDFELLTAENMKKVAEQYGGVDDDVEFVEWTEENGYPVDTKVIVVALTKHGKLGDLPCVDAASEVFPNVLKLVHELDSVVGEYQGNIPGIKMVPGVDKSKKLQTRTRRVHERGLSLEATVSIESEPDRSFWVIEDFFELGVGFCKEQQECDLTRGHK
ncbi:hypothetical protein [uncultured Ruegeria sp.]|uniref:hypothetical protein n=1 Tax=uncultured Ruegeria sp. TaxID=259304 RepID=UPI00260A9424|nr:hypothetical protein [uncultured Ruegeria sp.]